MLRALKPALPRPSGKLAVIKSDMKDGKEGLKDVQMGVEGERRCGDII